MQDNSIVFFKNNILPSAVRTTLDNYISNFIMYDYIMNPSNYRYARNVDIKTLFADLQGKSVPFAEIWNGDSTITILMAKVPSEMMHEWRRFCQPHFSVLPSFGQITSQNEMIVVQKRTISWDELNKTTVAS